MGLISGGLLVDVDAVTVGGEPAQYLGDDYGQLGLGGFGDNCGDLHNLFVLHFRGLGGEEARVQQELAIAFRSQDRGIDDFDLVAAECGNRLAELGHGTELGRLAAHDSALAD